MDNLHAYKNNYIWLVLNSIWSLRFCQRSRLRSNKQSETINILKSTYISTFSIKSWKGWQPQCLPSSESNHIERITLYNHKINCHSLVTEIATISVMYYIYAPVTDYNIL